MWSNPEFRKNVQVVPPETDVESVIRFLEEQEAILRLREEQLNRSRGWAGALILALLIWGILWI